MHSLLHDIPRFLEELFLIFNQMLSIRAFGKRAIHRLFAYCRELAPGTVSLTGDRAQGYSTRRYHWVYKNSKQPLGILSAHCLLSSPWALLPVKLMVPGVNSKH